MPNVGHYVNFSREYPVNFWGIYVASLVLGLPCDPFISTSVYILLETKTWLIKKKKYNHNVDWFNCTFASEY